MTRGGYRGTLGAKLLGSIANSAGIEPTISAWNQNRSAAPYHLARSPQSRSVAQLLLVLVAGGAERSTAQQTVTAHMYPTMYPTDALWALVRGRKTARDE